MAEEEGHQFFSDTEEHQEKAKTVPPAKKSKKTPASSNNKRYIVFVGNLPYEAVKQDLETLFKHLEVKSIRMLTDRVTGKSKGTAFVEFADVESFQKAFDLHRTKVKGRKINIEMTAGGGGNRSDARKEKIQMKNKKFREEREQQKSQKKATAEPQF